MKKRMVMTEGAKDKQQEASAGLPAESRYWDSRWQEGQTGWDLGGPHPLLGDLIGRATAFGLAADARIFIPGCGRAHDGIWLVRHGYRVVAADFAPRAVAAARQNAADLVASGSLKASDAAHMTFRVEDAATCPEADQGGFQGVFDRAMFCALRPELRGAYIEALAARLQKHGLFMSLLFSDIAPTPQKPKGSGPPFEVTESAVSDQLSPWFERVVFETRRDGATDQRILSEFFTIWKRR